MIFSKTANEILDPDPVKGRAAVQRLASFSQEDIDDVLYETVGEQGYEAYYAADREAKLEIGADALAMDIAYSLPIPSSIAGTAIVDDSPEGLAQTNRSASLDKL